MVLRGILGKNGIRRFLWESEVLAALIVLPLVASAIRPLAKALMKDYCALAGVVKPAAAEAAREEAVEIGKGIAVEAGEGLVESAA